VTGVRGDGVSDYDVSIGGLYSYKCHAASMLRLLALIFESPIPKGC
jgi:hypothetical protein